MPAGAGGVAAEGTGLGGEAAGSGVTAGGKGTNRADVAQYQSAQRSGRHREGHPGHLGGGGAKAGDLVAALGTVGQMGLEAGLKRARSTSATASRAYAPERAWMSSSLMTQVLWCRAV